MKKIVNATVRFWKRDEGSWLIEYGLLISLVAIACMSVIALFGISVREYLLNVATVLGGV